MNVLKRIAVVALGLLVLLSVAAANAATKRQRPSEVVGAETSMAPNDFQVYNDYATSERTYSSGRAVVHYVVVGIEAPPLNDDDADRVPDYVERVGQAADRALTYYERRGFRPPLPDEGGPDAKPDLYISRFSPGTLGVAFPDSRAQGGAFAVVSNNLDPSAERSFASVYATVAHELFHLVQFSYFGRSEPVLPTWILEGSAAALETRVNPELDDLVSSIQLRSWFSATERSMTERSYGAQLLWRWLDREEPRFLAGGSSAYALVGGVHVLLPVEVALRIAVECRRVPCDRRAHLARMRREQEGGEVGYVRVERELGPDARPAPRVEPRRGCKRTGSEARRAEGRGAAQERSASGHRGTAKLPVGLL